jgi:type VI secretion system secreted protein VgrG
MSAPKIIALILEEHGIQGNADRFQLGQPYPERDYCVQYDETNLHFVQCLCEEEGVHYHFIRRLLIITKPSGVRILIL